MKVCVLKHTGNRYNETNSYVKINSNIATLLNPSVEGCSIAWVDLSALRVSNLSQILTPSSINRFDFNGLASLTDFNGITFLYHQIDHATIVEENWDGETNEFRDSNRFSVDLS